MMVWAFPVVYWKYARVGDLPVKAPPAFLE